jgi:hypothetical protein
MKNEGILQVSTLLFGTPENKIVESTYLVPFPPSSASSILAPTPLMDPLV